MKRIIDVSSAIYGGHAGNDRRIRGFPVGGLRKLFGIINAGLSEGDFALCFDGGQIIKKELLPTYKAGRVPDYSVLAQVELAKELCLRCNIPFYHDPQYEADDFVYSICDELLNLGDLEEVQIYSDDRDLSCCVTDNISIHNMTSNGMCISRRTYEERVVRGRTIPYNTILLWKVFHGDPSDNYRALQIPGLNFEGFAYDYVQAVSPLIGPEGFNDLGYIDYNVFCAAVNSLGEQYTGQQLDMLKNQGRIAFPYRIAVSTATMEEYGAKCAEGIQLYTLERQYMKFFGMSSFNYKKFEFYCTLLGLNKTKPARSVDRDSAEAQEFYRLLELRAKELANGTMAVERFRSKREVRPHGATIKNMELPI